MNGEHLVSCSVKRLSKSITQFVLIHSKSLFLLYVQKKKKKKTCMQNAYKMQRIILISHSHRHTHTSELRFDIFGKYKKSNNNHISYCFKYMQRFYGIRNCKFGFVKRAVNPNLLIAINCMIVQT